MASIIDQEGWILIYVTNPGNRFLAFAMFSRPCRKMWDDYSFSNLFLKFEVSLSTMIWHGISPVLYISGRAYRFLMHEDMLG